MVKFITLAGKKQVGKDTSAGYIKRVIEQNTDRRVYVVHFADALKRACSEIFGIEPEDMETETGKQKLTDVLWPRNMADYKADQESTWIPSSRYVDYCKQNNREITGAATSMTVREVLQFVGTELFRNQMDPDIWVKSVYRKKYRDDAVVIVADCRFPNEAEFARKNGLLISVERNTGLATDGHASETSLDSYSDYHYVIDNNSSFANLFKRLDAILEAEKFVVHV